MVHLEIAHLLHKPLLEGDTKLHFHGNTSDILNRTTQKLPSQNLSKTYLMHRKAPMKNYIQ